jgi:hypothetical protein
MRLRMRRWRLRPSTTTLLSVAAIVISVGQLFFTAPILTQYYFRPDLIIGGAQAMDIKSDKFFGTQFELANRGNAPATNIEVGFTVEHHHKITLQPAIRANIAQEDYGFTFKRVRVEIERLSEGEKVFINIIPTSSEKPAPIIEYMFSQGLKLLPHFDFVRSAEGPGRYVGERHLFNPKFSR